jgi:hypothetical protein
MVARATFSMMQDEADLVIPGILGEDAGCPHTVRAAKSSYDGIRWKAWRVPSESARGQMECPDRLWAWAGQRVTWAEAQYYLRKSWSQMTRLWIDSDVWR